MVIRLLFFSATALCFLCSVLYHTFSHEDDVEIWRHVDHSVIQTCIWATTCSFVAVGFRQINKRLFYKVYAAVGLFAFAARLWTMMYHESDTQRIRTAIHVSFGALSTLPALHCGHCRGPLSFELFSASSLSTV
jgi:channel protein (hemolysin III family)